MVAIIDANLDATREVSSDVILNTMKETSERIVNFSHVANCLVQ